MFMVQCVCIVHVFHAEDTGTVIYGEKFSGVSRKAASCFVSLVRLTVASIVSPLLLQLLLQHRSIGANI